jgi:hypothetical protein
LTLWFPVGLENHLELRHRLQVFEVKHFHQPGDWSSALNGITPQSMAVGLIWPKVVELHIVDRASDSTIGRALKKTFSNPIVDSAGSSRRRPIARS